MNTLPVFTMHNKNEYRTNNGNSQYIKQKPLIRRERKPPINRKIHVSDQQISSVMNKVKFGEKSNALFNNNLPNMNNMNNINNMNNMNNMGNFTPTHNNINNHYEIRATNINNYNNKFNLYGSNNNSNNINNVNNNFKYNVSNFISNKENLHNQNNHNNQANNNSQSNIKYTMPNNNDIKTSKMEYINYVNYINFVNNNGLKRPENEIEQKEVESDAESSASSDDSVERTTSGDVSSKKLLSISNLINPQKGKYFISFNIK
jgi:hypothetical protein